MPAPAQYGDYGQWGVYGKAPTAHTPHTPHTASWRDCALSQPLLLRRVLERQREGNPAGEGEQAGIPVVMHSGRPAALGSRTGVYVRLPVRFSS